MLLLKFELKANILTFQTMVAMTENSTQILEPLKALGLYVPNHMIGIAKEAVFIYVCQKIMKKSKFILT